jgi:hypothetical protein
MTYMTHIQDHYAGRYRETHEPLGRNIVQTLGHYLWGPMTLMGLMLVATAFALGVARAQLSVDLSEEFTPLRKANFETLGQLVPGFMFLGFAFIFSGISFAIARILGAFRTGGGDVQGAVGGSYKTLVMPFTAWAFLATMMMAMMVLIFAFAGHIYAATQAHDAWVNATGPGSPDAASLGPAETWGTWLEGLRRVGVGLFLTAIAFGLTTITNVIRFQTLRFSELGTERSAAE